MKNEPRKRFCCICKDEISEQIENHSKNSSNKNGMRNVPRENLCSSELCKELHSLFKQSSRSLQNLDDKSKQNHSSNKNRYESIYENLILKYTGSYKSTTIEFESNEQFSKTAFFEEKEANNIIKAVRAAFWANKAAHLFENNINNLNPKEKSVKLDDSKQKMQVFYTLKTLLIKEAIDKLHDPEMRRFFPSWGFSKDENSRDTFVFDAPGHGQIAMHIKPYEIGHSVVENNPYKYRFSGLTNPTFPSADRFDGVQDDTLARIHHVCVVNNDFKRLDKLYNRNIYDYHFCIPDSSLPSAKNGINTISVKTLFAEKNGHLVSLDKVDHQPDVLYGAINCKEAQALLFFQIVPYDDLKGEIKKPFHFVSYKNLGRNPEVLLRTGTPEAKANKRDSFSSDTVVVYCDLDSNGKFVTNSETYKRGGAGIPPTKCNKSVAVPSPCEITPPPEKFSMMKRSLALSR